MGVPPGSFLSDTGARIQTLSPVSVGLTDLAMNPKIWVQLFLIVCPRLEAGDKGSPLSIETNTRLCHVWFLQPLGPTQSQGYRPGLLEATYNTAEKHPSNGAQISI